MNYTVAANVLSRNKHEIGGYSLKVKQFQASGMEYEQDKIKITTTIPQNCLSLLVETQLDMDKEFTLIMIDDRSYILVFNSAHTIKGMSWIYFCELVH